jgi:hypothetical protein
MIKLLAICPADFDGTSYYRAHGIFPNLIKQMDNQLRVEKYYGDMGRGYNWSDLIQYDIIFLQRPCQDARKRMKLVEFCKSMGKKIWIDFDDNLFSLPRENRMFSEVTDQLKRDMVDILKLADVITVSTKALGEFFATLGLVTEVVPNALNEDITPMCKRYNEIQNKMDKDYIKTEQFLWRGSETHQGDLYYVGMPGIFNAVDNRPNTHWHFLGYDPWYITNAIEPVKYTFHKPDDIMQYFPNLRKLRPQVVHFPLFPNSINYCKSNIAWIEATAVGAVVIAPDWDEWKRPGIINYTSTEHYAELLMKPIDGYAELWKASRDYIMENLTLDKVNEQRVKIIDRLLGLSTVTIGLSNLPETMIE